MALEFPREEMSQASNILRRMRWGFDLDRCLQTLHTSRKISLAECQQFAKIHFHLLFCSVRAGGKLAADALPMTQSNAPFYPSFRGCGEGRKERVMSRFERQQSESKIRRRRCNLLAEK